LIHSLWDYPLRTIALETLFSFCAALQFAPPAPRIFRFRRGGQGEAHRCGFANKMAFKETRRGFLSSKCMPTPGSSPASTQTQTQAQARAQQASRRAGVGRKVTTAGKFRIHPFVIEVAPLGHIRAVVPE